MTIEKIRNLFYEGQVFGKPNLYGSNQNTVGPSNTGGGGWAGTFTNTGKKGEANFGVIEEEDELSIDKASEELDKANAPEGSSEDTSKETPEEPSDDNSESTPEESTDTSEEPQETPEDNPEEPSNDAPETAPVEPQETPEQKINEMFGDTDDVNSDYSLTNENNIRLEKFKFVNAGLDLEKIIPEDDLKNGISSKDVMGLLTPSQIDVLKEKTRELRKEYPLIDKREKNIIIHNSNIPMYSIQEGSKKEIGDEYKKQSYEKMNAYMEENFGKNWQDKNKAIEFLRTIKINFDDKPAIRANLLDLPSMIVEEGDTYKIPLDKINIFTPAIINDFIKSNKEEPTFNKSNIFRTIVSSFNQEYGSKGQIYVVFDSENIKGQDEASEDDTMEPETPDEGASSEETPEGSPEETPSEGETDSTDELDSAVENAVPKLPVG
jgi:hypothetical protein